MKRWLAVVLVPFAFLRAADGRLLEFSVAPGEADRFRQAEFSCWLPDTTRPLRAVIIHQHGCPAGSPERHPSITGDWHWRALARKHDTALLVPQYRVTKTCDEWNDPANGSERALLAALTEFSRRSGRAELATVRWLLWGHSGGSSWSAQMILRHPGRVLAASFRGGCHKQFGEPEFRRRFIAVAHELPLLFVWGAREAVPASSHFVSWEPMNTMFRELRAAGGRVTRVIDPRSEHNCDDSRLLSIPFFDAVLAGEAGSGMAGDIATREIRPFDPASRHDPNCTWLPQAGFAARWREYSEHGTVRPTEPPGMAPELWAGREAGGAVRLEWRVVPEIAGGLRAIVIRRDGRPWREFGLKPGDFLATARDSAPAALGGSGTRDDSRGPHTYTLTFHDAAGRESPPSRPVAVE